MGGSFSLSNQFSRTEIYWEEKSISARLRRSTSRRKGWWRKWETLITKWRERHVTVQSNKYQVFLLNFFNIYSYEWILDLKRDSSICSARDRLIKNPSLIIDINYQKEKLDKSLTKLLTLITLLSIFFLFWIQNSHYHLLDNLRNKYKTKYG